MIKYKVIGNKGVVKAFLYDTDRDVYNKLLKEHRKLVDNCGGFNLLNKSYYGKAQVSENDDWDEDTGKRIAKDRLLVKYYDDRVASGIEIAEFYEKLLVELYTMLGKDFNKRADYIRDLEEMGIDV